MTAEAGAEAAAVEAGRLRRARRVRRRRTRRRGRKRAETRAEARAAAPSPSRPGPEPPQPRELRRRWELSPRSRPVAPSAGGFGFGPGGMIGQPADRAQARFGLASRPRVPPCRGESWLGPSPDRATFPDEYDSARGGRKASRHESLRSVSRDGRTDDPDDELTLEDGSGAHPPENAHDMPATQKPSARLGAI
jgi:hypothetical protein